MRVITGFSGITCTLLQIWLYRSKPFCFTHVQPSCISTLVGVTSTLVGEIMLPMWGAIWLMAPSGAMLAGIADDS